ncbi:MAG: response regulator [Verrucomicrobia bacterium]|nr:MAG: response regulator [Verrucomicrobiota bacterium]
MNLSAAAEGTGTNPPLSSQIVVIEDDPVVRRLLRLCLYQAGLEVVAFASGEEAIRFLSEDGHSVSLIITDGIMPGMDGFAVARWCQENLPDVRLVLLSGYLYHFIAQKEIPENIEAFFTKPFSTRELVAKVRDLVGTAA